MLQLFREHASSRAGQSYSTDGGYSWAPIVPSPITTTNSGLHAIVLYDGRVLVVFNEGERRGKLALATSNNHGVTYHTVAYLEDATGQLYERQGVCHREHLKDQMEAPELSYPSMIQASDGMVHITYTFSYYGADGRCDGRQNIKHVILDPCKLGDSSSAPCPCTQPGSEQATKTAACKAAFRGNFSKSSSTGHSPYKVFNKKVLTSGDFKDFAKALRFTQEKGLQVEGPW